MNKIKVVHVLNSVGGVDVSLRLILENINPDKFESIVIHGDSDTKKVFLDKNGNSIKEYKLPIQRELNFFKDFKSIYSTFKIIKKEKPEIIHAHSAKGGVVARAANIFFKTKVFHTPQAYSYLSAESKLKKRIFLFIEQFFKQFNSVLVASSESERQRGLKEVNYSSKNALLFNNSILPIKLNKNNPSQILDRLFDDYICTVGRPSFQKNIEMMIEVIHKLKQKNFNVNLVILGVGEYSPNIESVKNKIKKYDLENNVLLIEWIDRNEIFKIIKRSKLYISTARYEGLPYSIIESLSLGKACVVTNSDGNRDLVEHNFNGFVVDNEDIDQMAEYIQTLYSDDILRMNFEKKALQLFENKFNMINNISKLEDLYRTYSTKHG
ncbi:glycosyltransferase [Pseudotamlana agarivorans]|uniref:glycosyltransferase n=1 Tax=Pseudotamlana agarivorans TaxID=481183 RepID=UPI000AFD0FB4|nr:glycosyltransferase [Tamlana agarivorans]